MAVSIIELANEFKRKAETYQRQDVRRITYLILYHSLLSAGSLVQARANVLRFLQLSGTAVTVEEAKYVHDILHTLKLHGSEAECTTEVQETQCKLSAEEF